MKMAGENNFTLKFSANLDAARQDLEATLSLCKLRWQLSDRDHFQLRMVLDELVTNTFSYGFAEGFGSQIEIELKLSAERVCSIVYTDDAPPFDSASSSVPKGVAGTEEMSYGGIGLSLVKQMVDTMSYHYAHGKNIIELKKQMEV